MKFIEVEDDLYRYIASQTESIGESASAILRRLLELPPLGEIRVEPSLTADHNLAATVVASPVVSAIKDELAEIKQELVQQPTQQPIQQLCQSSDEFNSLVEHPQVLEQKASIGRFLMILSLLYRQQPQQFANVLNVSGRDRLYFAKDEDTLLASGPSSKPKQIESTPYWVVTNSNNGMKCRILRKALLAMDCSGDVADQIIEQI